MSLYVLPHPSFQARKACLAARSYHEMIGPFRAKGLASSPNTLFYIELSTQYRQWITCSNFQISLCFCERDVGFIHHRADKYPSRKTPSHKVTLLPAMAFSSFRRRVFGHEKEETNGDEITSSAENVEGVLGSECKGADDAPHIQPVATPDSEKASPEATSGQDSGEEYFGDDDPVLRDIPWHVWRIVSFHDDPTEQTLTFRYFVLTFLFLIPGAFLSQLSSYRTTYAPYSVFFVQPIMLGHGSPRFFLRRRSGFLSLDTVSTLTQAHGIQKSMSS